MAAWPLTFGGATAGMAVAVAHAGDGSHPAFGSGWWLILWMTLLTAAAVYGYVRLSRRASRKTAELRRELFERQMAEKELLTRDQELRQSLTEKESLLKEIHHRVKNNLQIVSSLLFLQEEYTVDPKGVELLRESQNRVKSMALIHEQLYGTSDLAKIDFGRYIQGLTANLFDAYGIDPARIRLKVKADDIALGVDMAVPCGLIINELVSNALKHAFPGAEHGTIQVAIQSLDTGRLEILVADDGVGMPQPAVGDGKQSLGLRLVETLTTQLDGTLAIETDSGTRFCITLEAPAQTEVA
jgi:two-component sensor histidine kinase